MDRTPFILIGAFCCSLLHGQDTTIANASVVDLAPYEVRSTRLQFSNDLNEELLTPDLGSTIEEGLNAVPGVFFNQPGGLSGPIEILIRGAEPNFTKTYVEGVEVNNPTDSRGGGFQLNRLDTSLYGSVDLTRGSHSAVQGSDAMGGLLAIRFPEVVAGLQACQVSTSIGSYGYEHYDLGFGKAYASTSITMKASHTAEDDRYAGNDFENRSAFAKVQQSLSANQQLNIAAWFGHTEITRYPDDSGGPLYAESDALDQLESEDLGLSVQYLRHFSDDREWAVLAGYYRDDSESISPGVAPGPRNPFGVPGNSFDDLFQRFQLDTHFRSSWSEFVEGVIGVSLKREIGESDSTIILPFGAMPGQYDEARNFLSAFTETAFRLSDNQEILLAQRLDKVDNMDAEWSPSLKYSIDLSPADKAYAAYHHGFKVPSLFALNNAMVGNKDLHSERVDSFEVGYSKSLSDNRFKIGINAFYQDYRNLIDMSEITQTLVNLSGVTSQGVELSADWRISEPLLLTFSATRLELDLEEEDEVLRFRPETMFSFGMEWSIAESTRLTARYQYIGRRWDSSIPTGNILLDHSSQLSLSLAHRFSEHAQLVLSGYNLLNEKKETAIGYRDRGSSVRLSIELSM